MIEIYSYQPQDFEMKFNQWAWWFKNEKVLKGLKNYFQKHHSYTIYDVSINRPVAILGFHEIEDRKFYGCIVAGDCFNKNPKYAIKMKYLVHQVKKEFAAKRVETISEDSPKLNRWHEFLGFKKEKLLPKYKKNRDFILWSMSNGD